MDSPFQRIAIVGLGLIGGSWALGLKKLGIRARRVGCDRRAVLRLALSIGAIDEGWTNLAAAVRGADLVILAAPVGTILEQLSQLKPHVSPHALVTDTGSTKEAICARARKLFSGGPLFLGGHPLAGKELSGFREADAALFKGARYALAPLAARDETDPRVRNFKKLVRAVGARPLVTDAATHDRAAAFLSHMPQLLSTGLASVVARDVERGDLPLDFSASGFRDMTRLAESRFELWKDISATNRENIMARGSLPDLPKRTKIKLE